MQLGKNNLLEELQKQEVSSRVRNARVVVLWIGKNHIGDAKGTDQRSLQRAGKSHETNMKVPATSGQRRAAAREP